MGTHKTAIVSKKAKLGKNCRIGPWCIIEDGVVIGDGTRLWQNVYIASGAVIGKNNVIHMGAVLGHEPQHLEYKHTGAGLKPAPATLQIGDNNIIREYTTIHRSFLKDGSTIIGNNNYLMGFSHVAHDCRLGDNIVMCQGAMLGGHAQVEDSVFIGGGAAAHQFARIGTLSMIGGLTRVVQDVVPYTLLECDAEVCGLNVVGVRRSDLSEKTKKQIKEAYNIIYHSGLNTTNALKKLKEIPDPAKEVAHIIEFIEGSKRGICKHRRKKSA